jgi:FkbM family methyltransferase
MINTTFIRQVGVRQWATRNFKRQFTKRVLKRDNRMRLPTGSMIVLPRQSHSAGEVYVTNANIDWGSEALFAKYADRGRDFIDVGAHIGYYSVYLSPLVRQAFAFEPEPRNIPGLQVNADLARNIEVLQMAVSSRSGRAHLHVGGSSSTSSLEGEESATIDVAITTIDEFLATRPGTDVALIKTDVEGHDLEALRGMRETVARCQPLILTESEVSTGLSKLCDDWHYSIFAFTCDRSTLKTSFRELPSLEESRAYWLKMLFLVPPRLAAAFLEHRS